MVIQAIRSAFACFNGGRPPRRQYSSEGASAGELDQGFRAFFGPSTYAESALYRSDPANWRTGRRRQRLRSTLSAAACSF